MNQLLQSAGFISGRSLAMGRISVCRQGVGGRAAFSRVLFNREILVVAKYVHQHILSGLRPGGCRYQP